MEGDTRVERYIRDLDMDADKMETVIALRDLVRNLVPEATEDIKWGALCSFLGDRAYCGIMPYKNYVSVIFDRGSELDDPRGLLEGGGKSMRHLKIRAHGDIQEKDVGYYVEQSANLPQ